MLVSFSYADMFSLDWVAKAKLMAAAETASVSVEAGSVLLEMPAMALAGFRVGHGFLLLSA
jgi:hypothetical protein